MKLQILTLAASLLIVTPHGYAETPLPPGKETAATDGKPADKPADLPPPKPLGEPVNKGLAWLAKAQNPDGGWGQGGGWRVNVQQGANRGRVEGDNVADPSDVGNTAIALQAYLRAGTKLDTGEHAQTAAKAAQFLLVQLEADKDESLFVTPVRDTQPQSKIGRYVDTFLAAQILSDLRGRFPDPADEQRRANLLDRVVAKIQKHQQDNGAFADNAGWASTLSQGIASRALNAAWNAGGKVDVAALEKDHAQNAEGLNRDTGAVAAAGFGGRGVGAGAGVAASPAASDAGVEIYRYASKLGGMTAFEDTNRQRRDELEKQATQPAATPAEVAQAKDEISKIDKASADQKVLLEAVAQKSREKGFVAGFGNHGGEEFISYLNIGEALRKKGGDEWKQWDDSMTQTLTKAQNADGSWAGQHCITGRTFCTASALLVMMTDRTAAPVATKPEALNPSKP
jgi:hypothetical protein